MADELGKVNVNINGRKETFGNPCIEMRCGLGTLVAFPTGDPGVFDEIEIDLVSDDGRVIQLACVGMDEEPWNSMLTPPDGYQQMHVYSWDGVHDDVQHIQYVSVDKDSCWYE